jgi:hypothetical protein
MHCALTINKQVLNFLQKFPELLAEQFTEIRGLMEKISGNIYFGLKYQHRLANHVDPF